MLDLNYGSCHTLSAKVAPHFHAIASWTVTETERRHQGSVCGSSACLSYFGLVGEDPLRRKASLTTTRTSQPDHSLQNLLDHRDARHPRDHSYQRLHGTIGL